MTTQEARAEAARTIIGALKLARERVTGDSISAKQDQRDDLKQAIGEMMMWQDTGEGGLTSGELRVLLGDPEDKKIRQALEDWA